MSELADRLERERKSLNTRWLGMTAGMPAHELIDQYSALASEAIAEIRRLEVVIAGADGLSIRGMLLTERAELRRVVEQMREVIEAGFERNPRVMAALAAADEVLK